MKARLTVAALSLATCVACGHHKKPADYEAEMRNAAIAGVREKIGKAEIAFFPAIDHLGQGRHVGSHHTNLISGECIVRRDGRLVIGHFSCQPSFIDETYGPGHTHFDYYDNISNKEIEEGARWFGFPKSLVDELLNGSK